jgi:hypothetical protein
MQKIRIIILLVFIATGIFFKANAQEYQVTGSIADRQNKSTLPGVSIVLTGVTDSTAKKYAITDNNGNFNISVPRKQTYKLSATSMGYKRLQRTIVVENRAQNMGQLLMSPGTETLNEVTVVGHAPQSIIKGDTTEMNASAFKVNPDASAEDLAKKMPTITIDNSGIKAQGETVKQVLVDGKPFFGDDPTASLRNLPADVIDKIQIFNKLSDQAQLTGFDDGNTSKTLNIITKKEKRKGKFGKFYAGYGTNKNYQAGTNFNIFNGDTRISIIGLSNNINQQNFSSQDIIGTSGGSGFGGYGGSSSSYLVGQQSGVSTINSLGVNYSDTWANKIKVSGSYFFNYNRTTLNQLTNKQYVNSTDYEYYKQKDNTGTNNKNNRINFRFEYEIDSMNTVFMVPSLSFQSTKVLSGTTNQYLLANGDAYTPPSTSDSKTDGTGYSLSNDLTYRHKLKKKGRTISININTSESRKEPETQLGTKKVYYNASNIIEDDTTNQWTDALTKGYSLSSNLMYTEPLGKMGLLQFNYGYSYSKNNADKLTYNTLYTTIHDSLEEDLSNTYNNDYITNRAGIGYRLKGKTFFGSFNLNYQKATLSGTTVFPTSGKVNKVFENVLPSAMFNIKFSSKNNIRVMYRASTSAPTISQLQNAVDNSNSLSITTGNPDLKQEYSNNLLTRVSFANPDKSTNFFAFVTGTYTSDPICSKVISSSNDTVVNNITLTKGTKLTMPVNLNNKLSANAMLTYGFPLYFINCNMNINTGLNYARSPGQVNNIINTSNSWTFSEGVVFSSNISENVDFTLSYNGNFSVAKNSTESLNNKYYSHTGSFKLNWIFWDGVVFQNDLSNQLYSGLSSSNYNKNYFLWNIGLGKKVFKNKLGEIKFNVFDLLNQNSNISRTVTGTYISDTQVNAIKRYYMLTFTYTLKLFKGAPPEENNKEHREFHENRGGGGGGFPPPPQN